LKGALSRDSEYLGGNSEVLYKYELYCHNESDQSFVGRRSVIHRRVAEMRATRANVESQAQLEIISALLVRMNFVDCATSPAAQQQTCDTMV
jgi:hypothetical protein